MLSLEDRRHSKCIQDTVHQSIFVDSFSLQFVDTQQFQRLRNVKQLGLSDLIYPGAVHTRFEHSVGTYFLANKAINHLDKLHGDELGIDNRDVKNVRLAALLHDLGHGPFSHVFEKEFLNKIMPDFKWSHGHMSVKMIDYIVELHHIDIEQEDLKIVEDMILVVTDSQSAHLVCGGREKRFLYDIVANGRNGIDVNKFDYVQRDARACGIGTSFNCSRLMENMRVIEDEVCFRVKEGKNIYQLFQTRADLHTNIYTHDKVKALELMLADVLLLADNFLRISTKIHRPEDFWKLDDFYVLKKIETSPEQELQEARRIIQRIRRRQLYQLCNKYTVPEEQVAHFKDVTVKDIICAQVGSGVMLKEEDVVVNNQTIDQTRGLEDPVVNYVRFFNDYESNEKFQLKRGQISHRLPSCFMDRIVRVYSKKPELQEAVSKAFDNFQLQTYGTKPQSGLYT